MPHIPILELRPELREQDGAADDLDDTETPEDRTDQNNQNSNGANAEETEANDIFHEEPTAAQCGFMQRCKTFIFGKQINAPQDRIQLVEMDNSK